MAEFVEKKVENMIPELEQMEKLGLFDSNEIKGIAKKRKDHEYKIQRSQKSKEDYLRYIQYEMDVLKLIKQRRNKLGINQNKSDIDYVILNRIKFLYKDAIMRFKEDLRFWLAYIKFCKHFRFQVNISRTITQMLQFHQDKPKCWCIAAHWELEDNNNVDNARNFLLRGLHYHPQSQLLYTEILDLELNEANKLSGKKEVKKEVKKDEAEGKSTATKENIATKKSTKTKKKAVSKKSDVTKKSTATKESTAMEVCAEPRKSTGIKKNATSKKSTATEENTGTKKSTETEESTAMELCAEPKKSTGIKKNAASKKSTATEENIGTKKSTETEESTAMELCAEPKKSTGIKKNAASKKSIATEENTGTKKSTATKESTDTEKSTAMEECAESKKRTGIKKNAASKKSTATEENTGAKKSKVSKKNTGTKKSSATDENKAAKKGTATDKNNATKKSTGTKKSTENKKNTKNKKNTGTKKSTENKKSAAVKETTETTNSSDEMCIPMKRAVVIYQQLFKKVKDVNFIIQILNTVKKYANTEKLQRKIVTDMIQEYTDKPEMWDTMARRELEGLRYDLDDENKMEVDGEKADTLRDRISYCNEVYQAAVKKIKTKTMWSLYIDCLLEINQDTATLPNYKKKLLKNALVHAHEAKKLEEKYYIDWIQMVKGNLDNEASRKKYYEVLCDATEAIPKSEKLWRFKLKYLTTYGDDKDIIEQFDKATELLAENSLPLWRMKLTYIQAKHPDKVEEVFQAALKSNLEISREMKPSYLEWILIAKGIQDARKVYNDLSLQPPLCLEMHKKMAALELIQPELNVPNARRPHEIATMQFGKSNTEVWIDFILFELKHGDPLKVTEIHKRAVKTLDDSLCDMFIADYALIKANPNVN